MKIIILFVLLLLVQAEAKKHSRKICSKSSCIEEASVLCGTLISGAKCRKDATQRCWKRCSRGTYNKVVNDCSRSACAEEANFVCGMGLVQTDCRARARARCKIRCHSENSSKYGSIRSCSHRFCSKEALVICGPKSDHKCRRRSLKRCRARCSAMKWNAPHHTKGGKAANCDMGTCQAMALGKCGPKVSAEKCRRSHVKKCMKSPCPASASSSDEESSVHSPAKCKFCGERPEVEATTKPKLGCEGECMADSFLKCGVEANQAGCRAQLNKDCIAKCAGSAAATQMPTKARDGCRKKCKKMSGKKRKSCLKICFLKLMKRSSKATMPDPKVKPCSAKACHRASIIVCGREKKLCRRAELRRCLAACRPTRKPVTKRTTTTKKATTTKVTTTTKKTPAPTVYQFFTEKPMKASSSASSSSSSSSYFQSASSSLSALDDSDYSAPLSSDRETYKFDFFKHPSDTASLTEDELLHHHFSHHEHALSLHQDFEALSHHVDSHFSRKTLLNLLLSSRRYATRIRLARRELRFLLNQVRSPTALQSSDKVGFLQHEIGSLISELRLRKKVVGHVLKKISSNDHSDEKEEEKDDEKEVSPEERLKLQKQLQKEILNMEKVIDGDGKDEPVEKKVGRSVHFKDESIEMEVPKLKLSKNKKTTKVENEGERSVHFKDESVEMEVPKLKMPKKRKGRKSNKSMKTFNDDSIEMEVPKMREMKKRRRKRSAKRKEHSLVHFKDEAMELEVPKLEKEQTRRKRHSSGRRKRRKSKRVRKRRKKTRMSTEDRAKELTDSLLSEEQDVPKVEKETNYEKQQKKMEKRERRKRTEKKKKVVVVPPADDTLELGVPQLRNPKAQKPRRRRRKNRRRNLPRTHELSIDQKRTGRETTRRSRRSRTHELSIDQKRTGRETTRRSRRSRRRVPVDMTPSDDTLDSAPDRIRTGELKVDEAPSGHTGRIRTGELKVDEEEPQVPVDNVGVAPNAIHERRRRRRRRGRRGRRSITRVRTGELEVDETAPRVSSGSSRRRRSRGNKRIHTGELSVDKFNKERLINAAQKSFKTGEAELINASKREFKNKKHHNAVLYEVGSDDLLDASQHLLKKLPEDDVAKYPRYPIQTMNKVLVGLEALKKRRRRKKSPKKEKTRSYVPTMSRFTTEDETTTEETTTEETTTEEPTTEEPTTEETTTEAPSTGPTTNKQDCLAKAGSLNIQLSRYIMDLSGCKGTACDRFRRGMLRIQKKLSALGCYAFANGVATAMTKQMQTKAPKHEDKDEDKDDDEIRRDAPCTKKMNKYHSRLSELNLAMNHFYIKASVCESAKCRRKYMKSVKLAKMKIKSLKKPKCG